MSQQNLEIVRATYEAVNRGDISEAIGRISPQAELDFSRALGPYRGVYRFDQVRAFTEDYLAAFDSVRIEPEELIDAGEQVVVPVVFHVRGRDGVEASASSFHVWTAHVCLSDDRGQCERQGTGHIHGSRQHLDHP